MIVHEEMYDVRLIGWREGAKKISATKAIMAHNQMGLIEAKEAVDRCLEGHVTIFVFQASEPALAFLKELKELNFVAEVVKSETGASVSDDENE